jgi:hypothetical protein
MSVCPIDLHLSGTTFTCHAAADKKTAPKEKFLQCHPWTIITKLVHAPLTGARLLGYNDNIFKLRTIITIFCKN